MNPAARGLGIFGIPENWDGRKATVWTTSELHSRGTTPTGKGYRIDEDVIRFLDRNTETIPAGLTRKTYWDASALAKKASADLSSDSEDRRRHSPPDH